METRNIHERLQRPICLKQVVPRTARTLMKTTSGRGVSGVTAAMIPSHKTSMGKTLQRRLQGNCLDVFEEDTH